MRSPQNQYYSSYALYRHIHPTSSLLNDYGDASIVYNLHMPERESNSLDWLQKLGVQDPGSLEPEVRRLAEELGPDGVQRLMKKFKKRGRGGGFLQWRGRQISIAEALQRAQAAQTLAEQGGGHWANRDDNRIGDTPNTWLGDEIEHLTGK